MELTYHHGEARLAQDTVHHVMPRSKRITVETEYVEDLATDAQQSLVDIINAGKTIAQTQVMGIEFHLHGLDSLYIPAKTVIDEGLALLFAVSMLREPLAQSSLDAPVLSIKYHLTEPLLLPYP